MIGQIVPGGPVLQGQVVQTVIPGQVVQMPTSGVVIAGAPSVGGYGATGQIFR